MSTTKRMTKALLSGAFISLIAFAPVGHALAQPPGGAGPPFLADDSVTSAKILDDTIVNADVAASAAIAGTKINPDFGSQSVVTAGSVTAGSFVGDGSLLTALGASNIASGTLADARLTTNVTLEGNTFNSANQLVKLDAAGNLPALFIADIITEALDTAIGVNALTSLTTGSSNTAIGANALQSNDFGFSNTASGFSALQSNTSGQDNTASGSEALLNNDTGDFNTASGAKALRSNTTGDVNTAIGANALFSNTAGNFNTASGVNALRSNDGDSNTAVGHTALFNITTGSSNTVIGFQAGINATLGSSNNIYVANIGPSSFAQESDTIRIGESQTRTFIAGIDGVTTDLGSTVAVLIDGNGQLGTMTSSRRYEEDIRAMGEASSALMRLRPVTFRYKKESANGSRPVQYGLIGEEVAKVYPDLVTHSPGGEVEAVQYRKVNAMLLNEVQKLHRQLQAHQEQIADLSAQVARLAALEAQRRSVAAKTR